MQTNVRSTHRWYPLNREWERQLRSENKSPKTIEVYLDVVWDQAPFRDHGTFVSAVSRTADDFVGKGLLAPTRKDAVMSAAARARNELAPSS